MTRRATDGTWHSDDGAAHSYDVLPDGRVRCACGRVGSSAEITSHHLDALGIPIDPLAIKHLAPPPNIRREVAFVTDHLIRLLADREIEQLGYDEACDRGEIAAFYAGFFAGYRAREKDEP